MDLLYFFTGLAIGIVAAWIIVKYKLKLSHPVSSVDFDNLKKEKDDIHMKYEILKSKLQETENLKNELAKKDSKIIELSSSNSAKDAEIKNINEKLENQKTEIENIQQKFKIEFKNLANEILEDKSKKFTEQNQSNINEILKPLNEKIRSFEKKVEETYEKSMKDSVALKSELKMLHDLNNKISNEANNLTKALKGDVKKQGNWGEMVLERILESSGLIKNQEYFIQYSTSNDEGKRIQPDVLIRLPDKKHIIIDAKVSLVAYEKYVNSENHEEKALFIKEHIHSVKNHIKELSAKRYQTSPELNTPEYVLLFIPIESSFGIAVREDHELFNYAWDNKIVIVSPSTLMATLMTISSIWKQENQTKHALEIARQSGALYDKFVGFVEDLNKIGKKIEETQGTFRDAMKKLSTGHGNLISRTEKIKKLGAKATKSIPDNILSDTDDLPSLDL